MKKNEVLLKRVALLLGVSLMAGALMINVGAFDKTSLTKVYANKKEYQGINNSINTGKDQIESRKKELIDLRKEAKITEVEANERLNQVSIENLEYHLPSILIQLEDIADANKLKIDINKRDIEKFTSKSNSEEAPVEEDLDETDKAEEEKPEKELEEDKNKDEDKEAPVKEDDKKDEQKSEVVDRPHDIDTLVVPTVNKLTTTVIPVEIRGEYNQVRKFLRDLDELNFIEPLFANIESNGDSVKAHLKIIIIHN